MRNVETHLLEDKMDEAVTHYINSHQQGEPVHVDTNGLSLNVQDETGRVVTVMQGQGYAAQMTRQVSVGDHVEGGPWNEELLDPEMRLAALVAHLAHQSRASHHHIPSLHKVSSVRGDVDSSVILDSSQLRLFNGAPLDAHSDSIVVEVPPLPPLPPLQGIKRCQETNWFHNKDKSTLKEDSQILTTSEPMMELSAGASPMQNKQHNKKSLPHKKRISRKLKRNTGSSTPQQDIVLINCTEEVQQEEILPDNFGAGVQHSEHLAEDTHHITQEVRPILLCQLCGEFYGEEQLKFFHHLKQHYEPQATIIIENPVPDIGIDKMTNTCIVDNSTALPDSIVELSLENCVAKTMYQHIDKQHILYTSSDKTLYTNKLQYSTAAMDKEPAVVTTEAEKPDLYDTLDKLETYSCVKCNKYFRKQKNYEAHLKEVHSNQNNNKLEDMGEFSEPEDLMEGIHVAVEEGSEQYDSTILPHLTVENGQVHQEHTLRHWYMRGCSGCSCAGCGECSGCGAEGVQGAGAGEGGAGGADGCPVCEANTHTHTPHNEQHAQLKEEVLQRIFESDVAPDQNFNGGIEENIIQESDLPPPPPPPPPAPEPPEQREEQTTDDRNNKKKKNKNYSCPHCDRIFFHRNSLLYHVFSHGGKQHFCKECGKGFYTNTALKVHYRVHNDVRPYKCDECERQFRQWSDLKYHKMSIHSTQKQFKCDFCGKEFARKYSLNVHRRIHTGEKNYKCDYCNKSFRASSYKLSHMRTHTGDKPFKCTTCEKCFRVAADLRRHMLTHERVRNRFEEQKKPKDEKPKKSQSKDEPKPVEKTGKSEQKIKKIAVASTTRPPLLKNVDKKPKSNKKAAVKKEGAPNVTVTQNKNNEQFKLNPDYPTNVEVFDTRPEYGKFKEVYSESNEYAKLNNYKAKEYSEQIINYKDSEERELAILRPMFRDNVCVETENKPVYSRAENSDGKMQVYTHVEKVGSIMSIGDIRSLDRDRPELHGESIENGFLENLTALYNIPAV